MTLASLIAAGSPADLGALHGERFGESIRRFAAERARMLGEAFWVGRDLDAAAVRAHVGRCLADHERCEPALYAELQAMARAARLSVADTLIVSGFTDLVDTLYATSAFDRPTPAPPAADQCTAFVVPGMRAAGGHALFGQTWDMHESAVDHVFMIEAMPDDAPAFTVFTSTGCPGMIGMNAHGITIGINNLTCVDGQPGVTWNFVVRGALRQSTIEQALGRIVDTPLAGAHNYLLLDAEGRGFNVEATPTRTAITALVSEPLVHTNHCLSPKTRAVERERPARSQAASERRLARAEQRLREHPIHDVQTLAAITRDPQAICVEPTPTAGEATCGAVIADPAHRTLWALRGLPRDNTYRPFVVGGTRQAGTPR